MLEVWNALRRTGREDIVLRSIISRSISHVYGKEVEIFWVIIKGKKIIIKTGKTLVNSELQLLEWDIKKESLERLSKIWIKLSNEITFRFT